MDPKASNSAKERADDMSSLAARFSTRMYKRAASAQGETTLALRYLEESAQSDLA